MIALAMSIYLCLWGTLLVVCAGVQLFTADAAPSPMWRAWGSLLLSALGCFTFAWGWTL